MQPSAPRRNLLPSRRLALLPVPSQYFAYSEAYLDSAERLCRVLARSTRRATFERGAVVLYLTHHALELFYKGAILKKCPTERLTHHDLPTLQNRYRTLYPGKQYRLKELFRPSYVGLTKNEIAQVQGLQPPTDQLFRYPEHKAGKPWIGLHSFEPSSFGAELAHLHSAVRQVRALIDV